LFSLISNGAKNENAMEDLVAWPDIIVTVAGIFIGIVIKLSESL